MEGAEGREDICFDNETGEIRQHVMSISNQRMIINAETGEPEVEIRKKKKKCFQVPTCYIHYDREPRGKNKKDFILLQKQYRILDKKFEARCIEESVIHGIQNVSPIVFMLPTLLIFPAWTCIVCILCEACIHVLSHKRNKMKKYKTEYKSPLHLVSSEFCGYCRSYRWKKKIKEIQDKRSMRRKIYKYQCSG